VVSVAGGVVAAPLGALAVPVVSAAPLVASAGAGVVSAAGAGAGGVSVFAQAPNSSAAANALNASFVFIYYSKTQFRTLDTNRAQMADWRRSVLGSQIASVARPFASVIFRRLRRFGPYVGWNARMSNSG
jgi:hypothetical protein